MTRPIEVTEEQVLYFRARRGHLAGPGAPSPVAAARAIIGAQSQQLPPAMLALSARCRGRPTAANIKAQLLATRRLVRTWGQRETLHLYDPATDWRVVVAARAQWAPGGRGGPMPSEATLDKALAVIESAGGPLSRSDLISVAPRSYVRALQERASAAGMKADRLAAARSSRSCWLRLVCIRRAISLLVMPPAFMASVICRVGTRLIADAVTSS